MQCPIFWTLFLIEWTWIEAYSLQFNPEKQGRTWIPEESRDPA